MLGCFGALGSSLPPKPTLGLEHRSCERLRTCPAGLGWVGCSPVGVKGTDAPSFPALGAKGGCQHPRAHLGLSPPVNSAQDGRLGWGCPGHVHPGAVGRRRVVCSAAGAASPTSRGDHLCSPLAFPTPRMSPSRAGTQPWGCRLLLPAL